MKLENLKYTHINKIKIAFNNIMKSNKWLQNYDKPYDPETWTEQNNVAKVIIYLKKKCNGHWKSDIYSSLPVQYWTEYNDILKKYNEYWKSDTYLSSPIQYWTEYRKSNN
jgi:hypothetical protein